MIGQLGDKGEYREILRVDFTDEKEYRKFVDDIAQSILCDFNFNEDLEENIAHEIIERHLTTLAEALLDKLIAKLPANKEDIGNE